MSDETTIKSEATKPGRKLTFDWLNRRVHLYLAMALLPWFLVYGVSSIFFSHPAWFAKAPPNKVLFEREYQLDPIAADADLKPIGAKIQKDAGLEGHFNVFRGQNGAINLWTTTFMKSTQVTYDPKNHTLKAENSVFRFPSLLTRLHTRGGFERPGLLHQAWGGHRRRGAGGDRPLGHLGIRDVVEDEAISDLGPAGDGRRDCLFRRIHGRPVGEDGIMGWRWY